MEPLYDLYYLFERIMKRVQDVNSSRAGLPVPKNQWIWPEVPTSTDENYPRITIQFLNLEEQPVSAGGYLCDNFKNEAEPVKKLVTGKIYNVTMWIGLFVKVEMKHDIQRPDGMTTSAKNTLLGNLLFTNMIKEIDKAQGEIRDVAFGYKPYDKTFALNYEDDSKRVINSMTINVPVLATEEIIFNPDQLIQTIIRNYEANGQDAGQNV